MLGFTPTKTEIEFEIIPITSIGTRSQPRLMNAEERSTFLHALAVRSNLTLSKDIQAGKGIFSVRLATSTQTSMISE